MSLFDVALVVILVAAVGWMWVDSYCTWKKVYLDERMTSPCETCNDLGRVPGGFVVGGQRTSKPCPDCGTEEVESTP